MSIKRVTASDQSVEPGGDGGRTEYIASSPLEQLTALIPSFNLASTSSPSISKSPFMNDPILIGALSALAGVGLALGGAKAYRRYWRRIRNADDITGPMLDNRRWIKGRITSVGDGDNFRLFHTPGPFWSFPLKLRSIPKTTKELKDETLHIRISGVDAPENAHFGNPAQPHAKESLDWLRALIDGKRMRCQILRKDQYNRIVAVPYIRRFILRDIPLPVMMLKQGMAVVYESAGAEYGPWGLNGLKRLEAAARAAKKGLWGVKAFEHPADYKKRMKMAEEGMVGVEENLPKRRRGGAWGLVKRLFGR